MDRSRYFLNEEQPAIIEIVDDGEKKTIFEYEHIGDIERVEEQPEEIVEEEPEKKKAPVKSGQKTKRYERKVDYDRDAVIKDIGSGMKTKDIAEKYNVNLQTVYNIKSDAKKTGMLNSKSRPTMSTRQKDELEVLTPRTREAIKDMRDRDMTSTEIAEELDLDVDDVAKVMSRHSSETGEKFSNQEGLNTL